MAPEAIVPPQWPQSSSQPQGVQTEGVAPKLGGKGWVGLLVAIIALVALICGIVYWTTSNNPAPSVALTSHHNNWITVGIPKGWVTDNEAKLIAEGDGSKTSQWMLYADQHGNPTNILFQPAKQVWVATIVEPFGQAETQEQLAQLVPQLLQTDAAEQGLFTGVYGMSGPPQFLSVKVGSAHKELKGVRFVFEAVSQGSPDMTIDATIYSNKTDLWMVLTGVETKYYKADAKYMNAIAASCVPNVP